MSYSMLKCEENGPGHADTFFAHRWATALCTVQCDGTGVSLFGDASAGHYGILYVILWEEGCPTEKKMLERAGGEIEDLVPTSVSGTMDVQSHHRYKYCTGPVFGCGGQSEMRYRPCTVQ